MGVIVACTCQHNNVESDRHMEEARERERERERERRRGKEESKEAGMA